MFPEGLLGVSPVKERLEQVEEFLPLLSIQPLQAGIANPRGDDPGLEENLHRRTMRLDSSCSNSTAAIVATSHCQTRFSTSYAQIHCVPNMLSYLSSNLT